MRRLLTIAAAVTALSIPVTVASVGLAGTAGATGSGIACASLKGTISGTVTIGKCTPTGGKGYKTATGTAAALASGGTITWSKSGATTTIGDSSASGVTPSACPKKDSEFSFSGTVTAASTTGAGIPAVGDTVHVLACVSPTGTVKLVKGTSISL